MIGWISIHRKLWENPRSKDPGWLTVWIYLLCHANHKESKALWNGKTVTLKPGQLITGRKSIAVNTGLNESKVFRVLKTLKIEQQIEQQTCNVSSLITIVNWEEYQQNEQQYEQRANNERTTSEQPANTPEQCNNVNNVNNVNKGKCTPPSEEDQQDLKLKSDLPAKDQPKPYRTKKGKYLHGESLEAFNRFWKAFDYTKGKADAAEKWHELWKNTIRPDLEAVIRGAEAEAKRRPKLIADNMTPKMAQGWLTSRRWEDEDNNPSPTAKRHRDDPNAKDHWNYTYNAYRRCGETEDSAREAADEQVDRYVQGDIGPISQKAKSA